MCLRSKMPRKANTSSEAACASPRETQCCRTAGSGAMRSGYRAASTSPPDARTATCVKKPPSSSPPTHHGRELNNRKQRSSRCGFALIITKRKDTKTRRPRSGAVFLWQCVCAHTTPRLVDVSQAAALLCSIARGDVQPNPNMKRKASFGFTAQANTRLRGSAAYVPRAGDARPAVSGEGAASIIEQASRSVRAHAVTEGRRGHSSRREREREGEKQDRV